MALPKVKRKEIKGMEKLVKVGYKIDGESEVFEGYALEDDGENWNRLIAIDHKIVDAAYWVDEGNCSHLVKTEIMQGVIDLAKLILEREELINSYDWDYLPIEDYETLSEIEDLTLCQKLGLEIDERNYKGVEIDR
jgi:hypothetical protein